jgi:transcription elongation factor S-II
LKSAVQALDLLNALRKIPIDLDVLQKTRIGMTVNNLRKSVADEEVVSVSKTLIRTWKKLLDAQKDGKTARDGGDANGNGSSGKTVDSSSGKLSSNGNGKGSFNDNPKFGDKAKQLSFPSLDTSNSVRLKCREMLSSALSVDFGEDAEMKDEILEDPENLAAKIEDYVFKEFKDTNMKYKNRIRSRVANLKDVKNPDLRLNVLRGQIDPSRIATMTAEVRIVNRFFLCDRVYQTTNSFLL